MAEQKDTAGFTGPIRTRLFGLTIFLLVASLIGVSFDALRKFESDLVPETEHKALVVGHSLATEIERALDYGIPLDVLGGMERYLKVTLDSHAEIRYIAVTSKNGKVLFGVGEISDALKSYYSKPRAGKKTGSVPIGNFLDNEISIRPAQGVVGSLHVGIDKKFIQKKLEDIFFDVLVVLLVSLLITFEFLLFLVTANISRPIESLHQLMRRVEVGDFRKTLAHRSRDEVGRFIASLTALIEQVNAHCLRVQEKAEAIKQEQGGKLDDARKRLIAHMGELLNRVHTAKDGKPDIHREFTFVDIRTPMFVFIFAEELSRSFLPLYINDLFVPVAGLSREVVIGLPISLFMLFVAIATPFAGVWTDRYGSRRLFLIGASLATVGFLGTALAFNLYDLLVWRSVTAIAYALITMACQGFIVSISTEKNKAQGMAVFIGAIMVAAICGTSIGGVLADRLGFGPTFFLSAGLALFSAIMVFNIFPRVRPAPKGSKPSIKFSHFVSLAGNLRFSVLMVFGAIPAKLILTGFLFYLAPLYLNDLGNNQSEIGRGMMLYFIIMVFGTPLFAKLSDKYGRQMVPIAIGGLIAGAGAVSLIYWQNTLAVVIGLGALGVGQAMSTAPLISIVPQICRVQVQALGQTTVLGVFRIVERIGSVAGPFVAAALIGLHGYANSVVVLGAIVLGSTVLMILYFMIAGLAPKTPEVKA